MSRCIGHGRLIAERKAWRKDHPHGFVAKPETNADGLVNMMVWRCTIPGKPNNGVDLFLTVAIRVVKRHIRPEKHNIYCLMETALTDWEGGCFPITLYFGEEYPLTPPTCKFPPGFFHPNVYPSGTVCLSILEEGHGWRAPFTVKQILVAIQNLLDYPNQDNAAQYQSNQILSEQPNEYRRRVREQASRYPPPV